MLAAGLEFLVWTLLGLVLGFAGHFAKSHFNVSPDLRDDDRGLLRIEPGGIGTSKYVEGADYTDAGFWDYYSLRNLRWYLMGGLGCVLGSVYVTADGHAAAQSTLCKFAGMAGLVPIFCQQ